MPERGRRRARGSAPWVSTRPPAAPDRSVPARPSGHRPRGRSYGRSPESCPSWAQLCHLAPRAEHLQAIFLRPLPATGPRDMNRAFDGISTRDAAKPRVQLALAIVVVSQKSARVDGLAGGGTGDLEMHVQEHGAAHRALIPDISARRHLVADPETGFLRHRVVGQVGVIRPLAIRMRDPDIIVVTESRGAA